jgi:NADPH-dependent ferric siderophore reductase
LTETVTSPVRRVMHELKFRQIQVAAVEPVTDTYLRVTFTGEDLADFTTLDPDDHMKLVFSADPDGDPVIPGRKGVDLPGRCAEACPA